MKHILFNCFCAAVAVLFLSSCEHDEPLSSIKPLEERTVLVMSTAGEIFDQTGKLVTELPDCTFASEIIADGNDYFVAGGFEYDANMELSATVWVDGVPTHYKCNPDYNGTSQAIGVCTYGDDVYVLTTEYDPDIGDLLAHLWLNGKIIMSYRGFQPIGFTVL